MGFRGWGDFRDGVFIHEGHEGGCVGLVGGAVEGLEILRLCCAALRMTGGVRNDRWRKEECPGPLAASQWRMQSVPLGGLFISVANAAQKGFRQRLANELETER